MTELKQIIEEANKKSLHYIGENYYYSTATQILYLLTNGKLSPVLEKGLNITEDIIKLYNKLYFNQDGKNNPASKKSGGLYND